MASHNTLMLFLCMIMNYYAFVFCINKDCLQRMTVIYSMKNSHLFILNGVDITERFRPYWTHQTSKLHIVFEYLSTLFGRTLFP